MWVSLAHSGLYLPGSFLWVHCTIYLKLGSIYPSAVWSRYHPLKGRKLSEILSFSFRIRILLLQLFYLITPTLGSTAISSQALRFTAPLGQPHQRSPTWPTLEYLRRCPVNTGLITDSCNSSRVIGYPWVPAWSALTRYYTEPCSYPLSCLSVSCFWTNVSHTAYYWPLHFSLWVLMLDLRPNTPGTLLWCNVNARYYTCNAYSII